ncbi:DNA-3-methyladenine glycosylase I [Thioclava sp. A2]|uniref:DNA-3-methyladenine glycosylase I n=1 Tax=Thioclava sp. FCG-A2 TaxID=3080562 RepID=UPI002954B9CB|nr:DNA-3-methyladenine glycosylase I [Thioclava sp. A2]MDV7269380.1 DNA-3-methyladenine glycosylase I [Thioclava sp. A2]
MRSYSELREIALRRKGGEAALAALMPDPPLSANELSGLADDRWLSAMAKCIFQAGFSWSVIEAKWPGFEEAFEGFDPARVARYGEVDLDRLLADARIVRNGAKVNAVLRNARMLVDLAAAHGTAARFFAQWPADDQVGLMQVMAKTGGHLGGNTGQRVLRMMGRDTFVLSGDVVLRLIAEGVVAQVPKSQKDMAAVQAAFNDWAAQSGESLNNISRTLALSIGASPEDIF